MLSERDAKRLPLKQCAERRFGYISVQSEYLEPAQVIPQTACVIRDSGEPQIVLASDSAEWSGPR